MPIDLSTVNWLYVAIMAVFAFVASLIGGLISFRNRIGGALLASGIIIRIRKSSFRSSPATPIRPVVDLSVRPVMPMVRASLEMERT